METQIYAVKSDNGEWRLKVRGNPWGGQNDGRDSDLEFFDTVTKFHEDKFGLPVAVHYHGYADNGQPSGAPEYIGKSVNRWVEPDGIWYEVLLDQSLSRTKELWDAALKGLLRASSGSVAHLVRKVKGNKLVNGLGQIIKSLPDGQFKDGHILEWPNVELSIFSIENGKRPANSYAVALPMAKAVYERANIEFPADIETGEVPEADGREAGDGSPSSDAGDSQQREVTTVKSEGVNMELTEVQKLVADSVASALKAQKEQDAAEAAQKQAIQSQIDAAVKKAKDDAAIEVEAAKAEAAAARRLPGSDVPYVAKFGNLWRYDNLCIEDKAILAGVLDAAKSANRSKYGASEDLLRALAVDILESKDDGHTAAKRGMLKAQMPVKANELNQSTLSSYGDEWIGVTYSTALWDKIRLATQVAARIPTVVIPQASESVIIPLLGTSPTFYKVAQASAQDSNPGPVTNTFTTSKEGTSSQTLTAAKMGAAVNYTGELEEDSLIPWVETLRMDLTKEAAEVLEHVIIDGDTATGATTNINNIGGTPGATDVYLLFNGFRKLPLVTTTSNSRSVAAALSIADFLSTVKMMGTAGKNAVDKRAVSFILDLPTNWAAVNLAQTLTRDVYSNPTIESGMLTNIYGYEVMASANMHRANQDATYGLKANTSGKVDTTTASNNTTGSILAVRWDQWRLGYKRQMKFEIERYARADATAIIVSMRVGMINRDSEASAISYGITGV